MLPHDIKRGEPGGLIGFDPTLTWSYGTRLISCMLTFSSGQR